MREIYGGWWWVAYSILVSAQGPLVLGLGLKGLGPGLDNRGIISLNLGCNKNCRHCILMNIASTASLVDGFNAMYQRRSKGKELFLERYNFSIPYK